MTESPVDRAPVHDPTLDQQIALRAAAERLEREFGDAVDDAAIERFLHSCYTHVAKDATVDNFLPLLAERYTRAWLQALTAEESV